MSETSCPCGREPLCADCFGDGLLDVKVVIVTGGRDYTDHEKIHASLKCENPDIIATGDASGADAIARDYAKNNNISLKIYKADWDTYGKSAGPKRNRRMLLANEGATVLAFKGGKGTKNCVETAVSLGMVVVKVDYED